ncbi:MAG: hypothetical protein ACJ79F_05165 [Gemmatimonadaceae bacterium]
MKGTILRSAIVVAAACVNIGLPASSRAQAQARFDKLDPLSFLAGSCWKGTFTGRTVTDEHCFEWIMGGRFLRDRHVVRGDSVPYEGETTYAWDAAEKRITYWYIALPGFYSHGNVDFADHSLVFHDNLVTSTQRQLLTTWTGSGPDAYTVRVEEISGGKSKELWSMVMQRSRTIAPK